MSRLLQDLLLPISKLGKFTPTLPPEARRRVPRALIRTSRRNRAADWGSSRLDFAVEFSFQDLTPFHVLDAGPDVGTEIADHSLAKFCQK